MSNKEYTPIEVAQTILKKCYSLCKKEENGKKEKVEKIIEESKEDKINKIKGGLADNNKVKDFDEESLIQGALVEFEHTNCPKKAIEIAQDHLKEDKDYYKKLKTIEKCENEIDGMPIDLKKKPLKLKSYLENRKIKLQKKQGVPEGADPLVHEKCIKDVKAQGHDKSSAFAICNAAKAGLKKNKKAKKSK